MKSFKVPKWLFTYMLQDIKKFVFHLNKITSEILNLFTNRAFRKLFRVFSYV